MQLPLHGKPHLESLMKTTFMESLMMTAFSRSHTASFHPEVMDAQGEKRFDCHLCNRRLVDSSVLFFVYSNSHPCSDTQGLPSPTP